MTGLSSCLFLCLWILTTVRSDLAGRVPIVCMVAGWACVGLVTLMSLFLQGRVSDTYNILPFPWLLTVIWFISFRWHSIYDLHGKTSGQLCFILLLPGLGRIKSVGKDCLHLGVAALMRQSKWESHEA